MELVIPFNIMVIVFIVPLPTTDNTNIYILLASNVVLKAVREISLRFGLQFRIHSDQGTEFMSHDFNVLCSRYHIEKSQSLAKYAEDNGLAERKVQVIQQKLKQICNENESEWDEMLSEALFKMRINKAKLVYGRTLRSQSDSLLRIDELTKIHNTIDHKSRWEQVKSAAKLNEKASEKYKYYYDVKTQSYSWKIKRGGLNILTAVHLKLWMLIFTHTLFNLSREKKAQKSLEKSSKKQIKHMIAPANTS
ncbi:hypothetical protein RF11_15619 [Thelohanellus kitauei]|uniref:Integrase catalytic domain-containing protein n=1 Tax=Thelohanellus kitauei TaxID=669202 RepID=A0A0C2NIQ7_THEKT|nr:hypothetical protein RF11_15619 [Thelohanellus kitauei]